MAQYINKSALVAEIKRLIDSHKPLKTLDPTYCEGLDDSLDDVLSFLDTLETKEVDLEKEVADYIEQHKSELSGYFDIRRIARHFFVLGLNQKENKL